jgi:fructose-bisphosphate aldolase/2-amino-3,7-dideoxy-D-threo-hept-6-ulosonate synthase
MATQCGRFFAHRDAPLMIVRINWGSHYCPYFTGGYGPRMATVRRAVSVGADLVIVSLLLGVNERAHADNIQLLGQLYEESEMLGIPLVGEFIPVEGVHGTATDDELVRVSVRLAAEVGVDAVKTVRTPGFKSVVEAVPVPVFALGGAKMDSEADALEFARDSLAEGAAGVVYGRNVFQADNPRSFLHQLQVVVKG